mgnify:CR=1 FL=1
MTDAAPRELTARAIVLGVIAGAVFGAANAYLGLRVGMTVATSIPVAVMTVAVLGATGNRATLLEANLAQTIGSASTALATGAIFTVPALYLWGDAPPYLQVVALTFLGGVLGVSAMIPLRRLLIVRSADTLPYPEGQACAEVLRATAGGAGGQARLIFAGMAIGAACKLALGLGALVPEVVSTSLTALPGARLSIEIAPALMAVGYILGPRPSAVVVSGSVVAWLLIIPLITYLAVQTDPAAPVPDPDELWSTYVRYIGAGAVACAAVFTVIRGVPAMLASLRAIAAGASGGGGTTRRAPPRTDRDVPPAVVVAGVALVVLAVALVPGILGGIALGPRLVCAAAIAVLGLIFVAVASRIVGLVGVSSQPTSGICVCTLLALGAIFAAAGWTSPAARVAVLLSGAIVAVAASKAGDISQDLKTGHLVGATPARQQLGQYLGAATACWAVAATVLFLGATYTFGSRELPAPQATLMKTIIEGGLDGSLPWPLVLAGAGLAIGAMLAGVEGLAFAIGVYLPLGAMTPIFLGGLVRLWVDRRARRGGGHGGGHGGGGVLAASGLVAGEGLAGVAVAVTVGGLGVAVPTAPRLGGVAGELVALGLVGAIAAFLVAADRRR